MTDQPYALRRLVPFERHGQLEAVALPALAVSVLVSRPFDQRAAAAFFGAMLTALVSNYAVTDYDAVPKS